MASQQQRSPYGADRPIVLDRDVRRALAALPIVLTAAEWTANNSVVPLGRFGFESDTGKFKAGDGVTAWNALAYVGAGGAPAPHAASHEDGGADEINVNGLNGVLAQGQIAGALATATTLVVIAAAAAPTAGQVLRAIDDVSAEWADAALPGAHAETHENGGTDEINVEGLSGLLGDAQTPLAHTHEWTEITDAPLIASIAYAPGTLTITDGTFRVMADQIQLPSTDTLTIEGTGMLRIV